MTTTRYRSADRPVDDLYDDLSEAYLQPLWAMHDILTSEPRPKTVPFRWKGLEMRKLAARAGDLVPVGGGGDRRVLAMANPGLGGAPFISTTLWAGMQYLLPGESAPPHRHTPAALRFIVEGDGVSTAVNGDPVRMDRGDLILTPAWAFHAHLNAGASSMMWLDILDLPMVGALEAVFYERGDTPDPQFGLPRSAAERLYGQGPGLTPAGHDTPTSRPPHSPLTVYRWADTDSALNALLDLNGSNEATVRYTDPSRGSDVMPTLRCEMTRLEAHTTSTANRQTGSRASAVLNGQGRVDIGDQTFSLEPGDIFVVPSWTRHQLHANARLDLFTCSDAPVLEVLSLFRSEIIKST
jgi:gentisate 1,2-dioxygenase